MPSSVPLDSGRNSRHPLQEMLKKHPNGKPRLMGILNVTPDSFHAASRVGPDEAISRGLEMWENGATWVDVGGESTRPNANTVQVSEELERVIGVIEGLHTTFPEGLISIDTRHPEVAKAALDAGASMVNDVSGLRDEDMFKLIIEREVAVCVMHMQGNPSDMQVSPEYVNCSKEIADSLNGIATKLVNSGHSEDLIVLDPGIGFGKNLDHNLDILRNINSLYSDSSHPILLGTSRKSMIGHLTHREETEERLAGTLATAAHAQLSGVDILRVHDVKEHWDFAAVLAAIWN